jgi:hypothetical protein
MKTDYKSACLGITIIALCFAVAPNAFADSIPMVPITKQIGAWRCWAGASESILKYYVSGFKKTQLELASVITTQDKEIPMADIVKCIEINGAGADLKAELIKGPLTFAQMKLAAEQRRPFIILLYWPIAPEYHCNVYAGFITDSTRIKCMDPISWTGSSVYYPTYQQLLKGNPKLSNAYWYYTIVLTGGNNTGIKESVNTLKKNDIRSITVSLSCSKTKNQVLFNYRGDGLYILNIFNMLGSRLYQKTINVTLHRSMVTIPNSFSSGSYIITFGPKMASGPAFSEIKKFVP